MSRVININGPGKQRHWYRRTIAEALRRLTSKSELDAEARDLASLIVFGLRGIGETVERTVEAWEKRNYYLKADRFQMQWEWAEQAADEMTATIKSGEWMNLPTQLGELMPHFADIRVARLTRKPEIWEGCYRRLMRE
jgi:hypothetical protein